MDTPEDSYNKMLQEIIEFRDRLIKESQQDPTKRLVVVKTQQLIDVLKNENTISIKCKSVSKEYDRYLSVPVDVL